MFALLTWLTSVVLAQVWRFPALGAWLPNIVFLVLGIFLLARSDHQHENRIIASIAQGTQWIQTKLFASNHAS